MNRKLKLAFISMVVATLVSTTVAAYLLTRQISNNMRILGAAGFILVREDNPTVEVTFIDWGDFSPLDSKTSQDVLGTRICIKNTGNIGIVVGWNATGLDRVNWAITATWAGNLYPENDYNQFSIAPGGINGYMVFTLTLINPYPTPGDYAFNLNFNAQPTP